MYQYIFFDLDGTLTDPKEGITNSVAYALRSFGIEEDPDKLTPFIGPPLHQSFMTFYGFDQAQAMEAVAKYREYFAPKGILENRVFPGAQPLLAHLKAQGRRVVLATSKPQVFARQILEHFHLLPYFDVVAGSELDGSRTRKSEVIAAALEELAALEGHSIPLSSCIMVGDRLHDVEGAGEQGMDCVGVTFGYGGEEELTQAGAAHIAHSFEELQALLDR